MLHRGKINKVPAIPRSYLLKPAIMMGKIEFLFMTGSLALLLPLQGIAVPDSAVVGKEVLICDSSLSFSSVGRSGTRLSNL